MANIGIDLGSRFVKVAIQTGNDIQFERFDTIQFYKDHVSKVNDQLQLDMTFLGDMEIQQIVATGYGRNIMDFSNATIISEIKAHYKGALSQTGNDHFTLIDIGGQDSKVMSVKEGYIDDFVMNDKCAASTGRFIENTCNILSIEMKDYATYIDKPVSMNSTCAIFSESEVIGKIAEGVSLESISAGVSESIAKRFSPMVKKYRNSTIYASGGVSEIYAIRYFLSKVLDREIIPLNNPQYNGAIGCLAYCK